MFQTTRLKLVNKILEGKITNETIKILLEGSITKESYATVAELLHIWCNHNELEQDLLDDINTIKTVFRNSIQNDLFLLDEIRNYINSYDPFVNNLWEDLQENAFRMSYNNCPNIPELAKLLGDIGYKRNLYTKEHEKPFFSLKNTYCNTCKQAFEIREKMLYVYLVIGNPELKHPEPTE